MRALLGIVLVGAACSSTVAEPTVDLGVPTDLAAPADLVTACNAQRDCVVPSAPVCDVGNGTCRPCKANKECPQSAHVCSAAGTCTPCTDEAACTDTASACKAGACERCTRHGDCALGLCDDGRCAQPTDVVYVDNGATGCATGDGSKANPVCEIDGAIALGKKYVLVAGSATAYHAIAAATPVNVYVRGPGRRATTTARLFEAGKAGVAFTASTGASRLVIDGFDIAGGSSSFTGVACVAATGQRTLVVRDSYIHGGGFGIAAQHCNLVIERNVIAATGSTGIFLDEQTTYTLQNNFVTQISAATNAIGIATTSSGTFRYNTISGNSSGTPGYAVTCGAMQALTDSIIVNNNATSSAQTQGCTLTRVVTGGTDGTTGDFAIVPTFVDYAGGDLHLVSSVQTDQCCVDKGADIGPLLPVDLDGADRPKGLHYDIGAHELK